MRLTLNRHGQGDEAHHHHHNSHKLERFEGAMDIVVVGLIALFALILIGTLVLGSSGEPAWMRQLG